MQMTYGYDDIIKAYGSVGVDCGILHDSPESTALHINEIWYDLPSWWNSSRMQSFRQVWSYHYARTSNLWWFDWMRALAKL